jgi:hypothetical protein
MNLMKMISSERAIPRKLASLNQSKFRSKFKLTQKERDYIASKGLETIKEHAFQFVGSRIAPDFPRNDGKQTPMRNHPVFIAQHATATCCRGCIQKWHGIEKGRAQVQILPPRSRITRLCLRIFRCATGAPVKSKGYGLRTAILFFCYV